MKYLIKFSYDGTNFFGYQKQPGLRTIETEFEKALYNINNHKETRIYASGRTDAGVHALCQCAHFDLSVDINEYKLKRALNSFLPDDIHVFFAKEVNENFNSRFDVVEKEYCYLINIGEYEPIRRNYIYQYNNELNIKKMKRAIKCFKGEHDFKVFTSKESIKNNYVRIINKVQIKRKKNLLTISFNGNGFMKYQVRNMVGTLIKIGSEKIEEDSITKLLNGDISDKFVYTAPPQGLYLKNVEYNKEIIDKK